MNRWARVFRPDGLEGEQRESDFASIEDQKECGRKSGVALRLPPHCYDLAECRFVFTCIDKPLKRLARVKGHTPG